VEAAVSAVVINSPGWPGRPGSVRWAFHLPKLFA